MEVLVRSENHPINMSDSNTHTTAPVRKPRKSLVAGEARRDRFKKARKGTGRVTNARQFEIVRQHIGPGREDFEDLEEIFDTKDATPAAAQSTSVGNPRLSLPFSVGQASEDDEPESEQEPEVRQALASVRRSSRKKPPASYVEAEAEPEVEDNKSAVATPVKKLFAHTPKGSSKRTSRVRSSLGSSPGAAAAAAAMDDYEVDVPEPMDMDLQELQEPQSPESGPSPRTQTPKRSAKKKTPTRSTGRKRKAASSKGSSGKAQAQAGDDRAAKKQKKKATKAPSRRRRRQTMQLVEQAQGLGVGLESKQLGPTRRSGRMRYKPLDYWRNECLNYVREPGTIGEILPVVDASKPISTPSAGDPNFLRANKKSKRRAPRAQRGKSVKKKLPVGDMSGDESEVDYKHDTGTAKVFSASEGATIESLVVKGLNDGHLEPLYPIQPPGPGVVPESEIPRACKAFDETAEGFATGILFLPPKGHKLRERAVSTEAFFVAASPKNALWVRINDDEFVLSRGQFFQVPRENQYELINRSSEHPIKLIFTLVRPVDVPTLPSP